VTPSLVAAILFGAAGGILACVLANILIDRYGVLSPLAAPPVPYPWIPSGPVSALTGAVLGALVMQKPAPPVFILLTGGELLILLLVFLVDFRAHLILDAVTYPSAITVIVLHAVIPGGRWKAAAVGAIVGCVIFGLLYALGWLLMKQEALGFGDVKLATLVGMMVGFEHVIQSLLFAAVLGGAASIGLLVLRQRASEAFIPYGIFLSVGAAYELITSR